MAAVNINLPESVLIGSGQSAEAFEVEAKLILVTKLFELGRISSAIAAEACGIGRLQFLMAAGRLGASVVQLDEQELKGEISG